MINLTKREHFDLEKGIITGGELKIQTKVSRFLSMMCLVSIYKLYYWKFEYWLHLYTYIFVIVLYCYARGLMLTYSVIEPSNFRQLIYASVCMQAHCSKIRQLDCQSFIAAMPNQISL